MKMSEITPEWIAERRDTLRLKDVDIYTHIGLDQDKFSKSMNRMRKFTVAERENIVIYLTGADAAARVPLLADIVREFSELDEADQKNVAEIVRSLARKRRASGE